MAHNFRVYGYLRASTKEQDALRAKDEVAQFAKQSNLTIASFFVALLFQNPNFFESRPEITSSHLIIPQTF